MRRTRRAVRGLGALTVAVGLAGCWPAPGQGPDRQASNAFETVITPATVDQLETKWVSSEAEQGVAYDPVVSNAGVHFTDGRGIYTYDRATGAELWRETIDPSDPVTEVGLPFADGGRILVGQGFGNLGGHYSSQWLDAATGEVQSTPVGGKAGALRGTTVLTENVAFGTNTPVALIAGVHDLATPGSGWGGIIDVRSGGESGAAPLTLGTARVYQAGVGTMLSATGGTPTRANGVRAYPATTTPSSCPAPAQALYCPSWSTPLDAAARSPVLASDESVLYTGTSAGTVYAVDTASGSVLWTASVGAAVTDTPALSDGKLYVPTNDGDLVVLAAGGCGASTCSALWQGATGSSIDVQPAVAGGVVFTGSNDGTLTAFDAAGCGAASCPSIWDQDLGGRITGAPAVSAGRVYVGTLGGFLHALGLP